MKIKIDTEKIISYTKANLHKLPILIVIIIALAFTVFTYLALYPRENSTQIIEGQARVQALEIRFNTKLLNELGATKAPTLLGTAGGRDPFSGF